LPFPSSVILISPASYSMMSFLLTANPTPLLGDKLVHAAFVDHAPSIEYHSLQFSDKALSLIVRSHLP